jgi:glutamine synthetase
MGSFVSTEEEFFNYCAQHKAEFVDFRFTDLLGLWRHITYDIELVDQKRIRQGIPFDGSSFPGWQPNFNSDLLLIPDVNSAFLDPFNEHPTINVICDVYDIYNNQPYEKCGRSIAKAALKEFDNQAHGDVAYFGTEKEFFIFENVVSEDDYYHSMFKVDSVEGEWNDRTEYQYGNSGHRPGTKGGYMQVSPVDSLHDIRSEMLQMLKAVGIKAYHHHHEVGQAQVEIGVRHDTLVNAADIIQIYKYIVKGVAQKHGLTATFMPKPLFADNGSGMHIHMSIWKNGQNLFLQSGAYGNLSDFGKHVIGGVLTHAESLAAFTNASANSYKRLTPGYEAPTILTYGANNRSASIRIPNALDEHDTRIEIRFPDSSGNPYLGLTSLLLASLDGINKKLIPTGPHHEDLFELDPDEVEEREFKEMPDTLKESLQALKHNHEFLTPVMTEDMLNTYRKLKLNEQVLPDQARPTPFEFITTFSC